MNNLDWHIPIQHIRHQTALPLLDSKQAHGTDLELVLLFELDLELARKDCHDAGSIVEGVEEVLAGSGDDDDVHRKIGPGVEGVARGDEGFRYGED